MSTSAPAVGRSAEFVVAASISDERLLEPAAKVLVAFSGGPDSTALALLLQSLGYPVVLAHVDHRMRPDSGAAADHCRAVAAALGLPIRLAAAEVPPRGECDARRVRYQALEAMATAAGTSAIATGHTLDDDAETVILRLGRGGYPLGIPPRRGRIVRPLLGLRRRETHEVCRTRGVDVAVDPSNADASIARNRIRTQVLPSLGDEGAVALAALARAARLAKQQVDAAVDGLMEALYRRDGPAVRLDRPALSALPADLREGVVRRAMACLGLDPSTRLVRDVCAKVIPATGARLDLPEGFAAWSEPREVVLARPGAGAPPAPETIRAPGRTRLPAWGIEALVDEVAAPASPQTGPWEALLDRTAASGRLTVRSRLPGDRYRPLGAPGERKLQDVLVDLKVPRAERDRVPVLTVAGRIAWVGGHRIDDAFKLTAASTSSLRVRLFPLLQEEAGRP